MEIIEEARFAAGPQGSRTGEARRQVVNGGRSEWGRKEAPGPGTGTLLGGGGCAALNSESTN